MIIHWFTYLFKVNSKPLKQSDKLQFHNRIPELDIMLSTHSNYSLEQPKCNVRNESPLIQVARSSFLLRNTMASLGFPQAAAKLL